VRFSTRGVQKHHKKLFGENICQKLLAEKVEKKKLFSFRLFPSIFFIAFLAVSLHEEPKNTIKIFSQIRPENLKKSQKRYRGTYLAFFSFFLRRPLHPPSTGAGGASGQWGSGLAATSTSSEFRTTNEMPLAVGVGLVPCRSSS
jgi:hypothetical protein